MVIKVLKRFFILILFQNRGGYGHIVRKHFSKICLYPSETLNDKYMRITFERDRKR